MKPHLALVPLIISLALPLSGCTDLKDLKIPTLEDFERAEAPARPQKRARKDKKRASKDKASKRKRASKDKQDKKKRHKKARLAKASKVDFRTCTQLAPASEPEADLPPGVNHLVGFNDHFWRNGQTIHVHFLDGSRRAKEQAARHASEWTRHANLEFVFHNDPRRPPRNADITVSFRCRGYWSMVGTGSRRAARRGRHSMCLGGLDKLVDRRPTEFKRVTTHEFGHALGMNHEHQNPRARLDWNRPYIYRYYARTQGWDRRTVDHNVLRRLNVNSTNGFTSDFDETSIMLYSFPSQFTTNGYSAPWNTKLSRNDKAFIAQVYPGRNVASRPTKRPDNKRPSTKGPNKPQKPAVATLALTNKAHFIGRRNGRNHYRWMVYVDAPKETQKEIQAVYYLLHPSYRQRLRQGDKNYWGHPMVADGWGTFTVRALVSFKDGSFAQVNHRLRFPDS